MRTNLILVVATTILGATAFADSNRIKCKSDSEADGQGYSAVIDSKVANIYYKSKLYTSVYLTKNIPGFFGQPVGGIYTEKNVNVLKKSKKLVLVLLGRLTEDPHENSDYYHGRISQNNKDGKTLVALTDCREL